MTPGPRIKPGTHWWKVSALTTAPILLPGKLSHSLSENLFKLSERKDCFVVILSEICCKVGLPLTQDLHQRQQRFVSVDHVAVRFET